MPDLTFSFPAFSLAFLLPSPSHFSIGAVAWPCPHQPCWLLSHLPCSWTPLLASLFPLSPRPWGGPTAFPIKSFLCCQTCWPCAPPFPPATPHPAPRQEPPPTPGTSPLQARPSSGSLHLSPSPGKPCACPTHFLTGSAPHSLAFHSSALSEGRCPPSTEHQMRDLVRVKGGRSRENASQEESLTDPRGGQLRRNSRITELGWGFQNHKPRPFT